MSKEQCKIFPCSLFFLFCYLSVLFPVFGQNSAQNPSPTASLAAEISRLESISSGSGGSSQSGAAQRHATYMELARLHQLSGNSEAALKAYEGALALSPGDGNALFEQGRLLISLGEYEKAAVSVSAMLRSSQDRELLVQGRYLGAMLETFRSGNTQVLVALADDPELYEFKSAIYYTLWKFTDLPSWKNRLITEFPQSPEAKIAAGAADSAITPLWLLFPGRDSLTLSAPTPSQPTASQAAPSSTSLPAASASQPVPSEQMQVLQTGLFSREENAQALAERLKKAGFEILISRRQVNGNEYWAVYVPYGNDMNAAIMKLKDAGFESFPVDIK